MPQAMEADVPSGSIGVGALSAHGIVFIPDATTQLVQEARRLVGGDRNGAVFHGNLALYECADIVCNRGTMRLAGDKTKVHKGQQSCITDIGCPFKSTTRASPYFNLNLWCADVFVELYAVKQKVGLRNYKRSC
jgi:hypothetical protein